MVRVVSHEVLDRSAYALALQTIDVGDRRSRRQKGIFPEVFEVTAAHRRPVDVDSRTEQEMHSPGAGVLPDHGAHSFGQFKIPGRRKPDSPEGRGGSIISHSNRSVGHLQSRQTNLLNVADVESIDTADKVDLLLQGQLLEKALGPCLGSGRRFWFRGCLRPNRKEAKDEKSGQPMNSAHCRISISSKGGQPAADAADDRKNIGLRQRSERPDTLA
jgi:hypothetical protein